MNKNLAAQNERQEIYIANFQKTLFETVKFEAYKWQGKYRYRLTWKESGESITITSRQLFSQTETRKKIVRLTMRTVMPYMKQAVYGQFVKAVMDISRDIDDIPDVSLTSAVG